MPRHRNRDIKEKNKYKQLFSKSFSLLVLSSLFIILLGGCGVEEAMKSSAGNQKAEDNFVLITSGYVVDVNDSNQILVVSPEQQNSVHDASWVSVPADSPQITLGMQVKVSVKPGTGIEDPYPRNFQADRIEVEPEVKPEGARLSRDQAVNKALEQFEAGESIPIVLKADYDQGHEKWKIKLKTDQSKSQPVWREVADVI